MRNKPKIILIEIIFLGQPKKRFYLTVASTIPNRITETSGIEQVLNPACCIPAHKNNSIAYYRVVEVCKCHETPSQCNWMTLLVTIWGILLPVVKSECNPYAESKYQLLKAASWIYLSIIKWKWEILHFCTQSWPCLEPYLFYGCIKIKLLPFKYDFVPGRDWFKITLYDSKWWLSRIYACYWCK